VELGRVVLLIEQVILETFQLFQQLHPQVVEEQEFKILLLPLITTMVELVDQVVVEHLQQVLVGLVIPLLQLPLKELMEDQVFTLELILHLKVEVVELEQLEQMVLLVIQAELVELEQLQVLMEHPQQELVVEVDLEKLVVELVDLEVVDLVVEIEVDLLPYLLHLEQLEQ
jgi:hypothetical protein